jgi:glycine/D-amino acid oxidase-like deaminating enzyme
VTGPGGRRLTIIGGGVMGLMTAYYAAPLASSVTVLDRSRVGDPGSGPIETARVRAEPGPLVIAAPGRHFRSCG